MKLKLFVCAVAASACCAVFAAWTTEEYINKCAALPPKFTKLNGSVAFIGTKSGEVWSPYTFTEDESGKPIIDEPTTTTCKTVLQVLEFGTFDDDQSRTAFLSHETYQSGTSKRGQPLYARAFEEGYLAQIYSEAYSENFKMFNEVVEALSGVYAEYIAEQEREAAASGGAASEGAGSTAEQADTSKDIDDALGDYAEDTKENLQAAQQAAGDAQKDLVEADLELAKYDDAEAEAASTDIEAAIDDFGDAEDALDNVLSSGELTDIQKAIDGFTAASAELTSAAAHIAKIEGDEVSDLAAEVQSAQLVIGTAISNLNLTKATGDLSYARAAKTAVSGLSNLSGVKSWMDDVKKCRKSKKAVRAQKASRLRLAQLTVSTLIDLLARVDKIREDVDRYAQIHMTDVNRIAAYLGSTNAMAYFADTRTLATMSKADIKRWMSFSVPEIMNRNETYDTFYVDGVGYNTILHMMLGSYFVSAIPQDGLTKLLDHFGMTSVGVETFRGFYESYDYTGGGMVTNWYANRIDAPINWADGDTIVVENGKYVARGGVSAAWVYYKSTGSLSNAVYQVGGTVNTCTTGTTGIGDGSYYLHVPYSAAASAYVNSVASVDGCFNVLVATIASSNQTYSVSAIPTVLVYE